MMTSIRDRMFEALRAADLAAAKVIIAASPEAVNARDDAGTSLLLSAVYFGRKDFIDMLREHGVTPDAFALAAMGDTGQLALIVAADPRSVGIHSPDGWTALHLAAHFGHLDACRLLLEGAAAIDAWSTNGLRNQPLHAAIAGGDDDVVLLLIEAGADVNAVQHGGYTPLHGAAGHGSTRQVEALLVRGADRSLLTLDGKDAATLAGDAGHADVALILRR